MFNTAYKSHVTISSTVKGRQAATRISTFTYFFSLLLNEAATFKANCFFDSSSKNHPIDGFVYSVCIQIIVGNFEKLELF